MNQSSRDALHWRLSQLKAEATRLETHILYLVEEQDEKQRYLEETHATIAEIEADLAT